MSTVKVNKLFVKPNMMVTEATERGYLVRDQRSRLQQYSDCTNKETSPGINKDLPGSTLPATSRSSPAIGNGLIKAERRLSQNEINPCYTSENQHKIDTQPKNQEVKCSKTCRGPKPMRHSFHFFTAGIR